MHPTRHAYSFEEWQNYFFLEKNFVHIHSLILLSSIALLHFPVYPVKANESLYFMNKDRQEGPTVERPV